MQQTPPPGRILVVDDDPTVAEVVTGYLDRAGFTVDHAADGPAALERVTAHWPDLVVLDLMLPGMDGLEVCRRLRDRGPVSVIMLTARGDEDDRILGLEIGADDYVTKPFSPRELVLRVESVLRRSRSGPCSPADGRATAVGAASGADPGRTSGREQERDRDRSRGGNGRGGGWGGARQTAPVLSLAGLRVDPAARRATKEGRELALTLREFDLLTFLLRHPGRACTREELMREVWAGSSATCPRSPSTCGGCAARSRTIRARPADPDRMGRGLPLRRARCV
ncbi:response regulator transcription factor [Streptomyces sp. M19]